MAASRRLFCAALPELGGEVVLGAEATHHARVLRLTPGAAVLLFDGHGRESDARLVALTDASARCDAGPSRASVGAVRRVVLVQCLPKGDKLEAIVRTTTEIGVASIALARGARSVARPDANRARAQLERLARIAVEAARQSERAFVPAIEAPAPLAEVVSRAPLSALRVALVPGAPTSLIALLREATPGREVWLVVGPEGGLDDAELAMLEASDYRTAALEIGILRVETAAPIVVALALLVSPLTP